MGRLAPERVVLSYIEPKIKQEPKTPKLNKKEVFSSAPVSVKEKAQVKKLLQQKRDED